MFATFLRKFAKRFNPSLYCICKKNHTVLLHSTVYENVVIYCVTNMDGFENQKPTMFYDVLILQ
jgi:hypothetical protein